MTTTKTIPIITTSITTTTIKTIPIMTTIMITIITIPRAIITITVVNAARKEQPYKCNDIIVTGCYRSKRVYLLIQVFVCLFTRS